MMSSIASVTAYTVRFGVRPVGIPIVGEGKKGGRDEIS
jgi:hypothetical protein